MIKEEFEKLKETVAYFGHWYDVIGIERVLILEKSIEYITDLEKENAELKVLKKKKEEIEIMTNFCKTCKKMHTEQLTKAIELLEEFCNYHMYDCDATGKDYEMFEELKEQAEQFLRETDIDNAIQKANEGLDLDKIADEVEQDIKEQKVK